MVTPFLECSFFFIFIFFFFLLFVLAGNEDMQKKKKKKKISDEFEMRPDRTTDYRVSCP